MGNRHPTGQNVVAIPEVGGGHNCDCSNERFEIEGALHDVRLTSRFPQDELRRKMEIMNEEHTKRAPSNKVWLIMLPCIIAGIMFFVRIRGDVTRCTGATEICNVTARNPDFAKCNRLWCCDEMEGYDEEEFDGEDYRKAGCEILKKNTIIDPEKEDITLGEMCRDERDIPGCDCKWVSGSKRGRRLECERQLYAEGETENFERSESNMLQMMLLGQLFVQSSWIIPVLYMMKKKGEQKQHLQKYFSDWKSLGISLKYVARSKHSQGMLYLILPSAMPPTAQATVITDAKVIPAQA